MVEQLEKIKALLASATNPKQKAMYQQLLAKLEAETQTKIEPEIQPKTNAVQSESQPVKPKKVINVKLKPEQSEPQPEPTEDKSESKQEQKPKNNSIFQAIGIIKGEVNLGDVSTIKIGDKEYRLFYIAGRRKQAYEALKKEIETTGNTTQRLIVYPKILHFPDKEKSHIVAFQIIGFISSDPTRKQHPLNSELKDFEFKLCGTWQFIPVCRTPCISVFRNFTQDRLAWIKEAEAAKKVKFMKASHAPLLWKDSVVRPFRFNPRLEKEEQQKTYFVELKARFLPDRDVFGFVELLSQPTEERPNFFKASKKMKAEALKEVEFKRRDVAATGETKPPKPVTVVNVEVSAPVQKTTDTPNTAESKQTTVNEDSESTRPLTSDGLEVLNPDDLPLNQLKSIVREKMNDDEVKKFGSLTKKSTWIDAYQKLN
ncbi:conserved hypothetical protein [Planktothrix serta PCC 8927]|uniref:Uncharacterized protein n=1 Tax=Planktothrix serta PCC 8927 TaxID=671068 RepID=A0A7Z9BZ98_9CYAN|nr:hypothetical protein [Planktothrix serta]VXD24141.1 conserved hypothetical protein [Planktothrix serta PCC 8927]